MRALQLQRAAVAAMCLALLASSAPLAAQSGESAVHRLRGIEIVDASWGQEVRLSSDGPLDRVGAQLFKDLGVVLQLPGFLPGPGVSGQTPVTGLVAAVELDVDREGDAPVTRVIVRTRQPVSQSVGAEGGVLVVRLAPAGLPAVGPATPGAASPATGDAVEVATLEGALERSNRARAELASRLENLTAETEALRERVRALESHREVLEADLETTRVRAAELGRDLTLRGEELAGERDGAARREAALEARIAALEAARAELLQSYQELDIRVQAGVLERRDLTRELDAGGMALEEARGRAAALDTRAAELETALAAANGEGARLQAEVDTLRGQVNRQYQRAKARTDAAELERRVAELTAALEQSRAEGERLAAAVAETGRDRDSANAAQVAELEAALAELSRIEEDQSARLESSARERRDLAETLETARRERDQATSELAATRAEIDRLRESRFDRELEVAREVEYRVADLRRELERTRARLFELEGARADRRGAETPPPVPRTDPPTATAEPVSERPAEAPVEASPAERSRAEPASPGPSPAAPAAVDPVAPSGLAPQVLPPADLVIPAWTTAATRLRAGPSTSTEILAALPAGTRLQTEPAEGSWTPATLRREGWLVGSYLDIPAEGDAATTNDRVNLRSAPSLDGMVLGSLPVGTRVTRLAERDGWFQVRVEQRGWVYSPLLAGAPPPPAAEEGESARRAMPPTASSGPATAGAQ